MKKQEWGNSLPGSIVSVHRQNPLFWKQTSEGPWGRGHCVRPPWTPVSAGPAELTPPLLGDATAPPSTTSSWNIWKWPLPKTSIPTSTTERSWPRSPSWTRLAYRWDIPQTAASLPLTAAHHGLTTGETQLTDDLKSPWYSEGRTT